MENLERIKNLIIEANKEVEKLKNENEVEKLKNEIEQLRIIYNYLEFCEKNNIMLRDDYVNSIIKEMKK